MILSFFSLRIFAPMHSEGLVYVIDAGNTSIKVATFENGQLSGVQRYAHEQISELISFFKDNASPVVISSVLEGGMTDQLVFELDALLITQNSLVPFAINYGSNTLGVDRLCNAAYLYDNADSKVSVCIDIGTCIKFDVMHKTHGYLGGSISPGIDLRYKALNDYTGKLPLLSNKTLPDLVGTDTQTSIQSGVVAGMNAEINGFVSQYESRFPGLTFFVTGGDAHYFDIDSKNDIFADKNLTLKGLYEIYQQNA